MIPYQSTDIVEPHMRADGDVEPELIDVEYYYVIADIVFTYSDAAGEFINAERVTKLNPPDEINSFAKMPEKEFVLNRELFDFVFSEYFRKTDLR